MTKSLTPDQARMVNDLTGCFTVRACPGSGKTFAVAARIARLLKSWQSRHQGIAAISFTNVAWQEIEEYLSRDFGVKCPLPYPHFLGTIDSFTNTYIFLPFGAAVMGCDARPRLSGPPHNNAEPIGSWLHWRIRQCNSSQCRLNDFTYAEDGSLTDVRSRGRLDKCKVVDKPCAKHKVTFRRVGLATQSDANYYSLCVLKKNPQIAEALASRFPVAIVDEAQDSSSIQAGVLDTLVSSGLRELALVGDPDQAVYEWRAADPLLFCQKCDAWRENSTEFHENWRSSQAICDFASIIRSEGKQMVAKNPDVAGIDRAPHIWGYSSEDDLPELLARFLDVCDEDGCERDAAAVLARGRDILGAVVPGSAPRGGIDPWNNGLTRRLAECRYKLDAGDAVGAFRQIEREACKHHFSLPTFDPRKLNEIVKTRGIGAWRGGLFRLLLSLPRTTLTLAEWVNQAQTVLDGNRLFAGVKLSIKRKSPKCDYPALGFSDVFGGSAPTTANDCFFGTVHSAKGRTFDAVMLVLKSKAGSGPLYKNLLRCDIRQNEELRILYVGITRPKKVLVLAVPQKDVASWEDHFLRGSAEGDF